jgi:hypothetical protein
VHKYTESGKYAVHQQWHFYGPDASIDGYLQSFRYFANDSTVARIQFNPAIRTAATTYIRAVSGSRLAVGIHVRHGDLIALGYIRFPPEAYFARALAHFRMLNPDRSVQFVVASDDPAWCTAQPFFRAADVHVITEPHAPALDMAILAACDHMALTAGTFGWWAAYLGAHRRGGDVVYYEDEFVMGHPTNRGGNVVKTDYYPPSWIPLGAEASDTGSNHDTAVHDCSIAFHYHIGNTGGLAVRNWFQENPAWGSTILAPGYDALSGPWINFSPGQHYIEVHCGDRNLAQSVMLMEQIQRDNHNRCNVMSFAILRDPHSKLCSAKSKSCGRHSNQQECHGHSDYQAYVHARDGHEVNLVTSITKHAKLACDRNPRGFVVNHNDAKGAVLNFRKFDNLVTLTNLSSWFKSAFQGLIPRVSHRTTAGEVRPAPAAAAGAGGHNPCTLPRWTENTLQHDRYLWKQLFNVSTPLVRETKF